ncbi:hypothetical protein [Thalassomonas actiniarum]|uniref:Uncharacterized protein n=1 Tax=Thalassomonas actiniarum TaxID=485447 RepID=A0AAE9YY13_9GAMM|nr:hypothetical protein [Thalassomonas actiniarum]WDE02454.1 hypothetical protein SG35_029020 [Thalassomonas actiniarum]
MKLYAFIFLVLLSGQINANEKTIKVAVAKRPSASETLSGPLPNVIASILDAGGINYQMDLFPFPQSLNQVAMDNLKQYKIVVSLAHQNLFDFPTIGIPKIEGAIKMIQHARVDGFIFTAAAVDPVIDKLKLNNIRRTFFARLNVKVALPTGGVGGNIAQALQKGIDKLQKQQIYLSLTSGWNQEYQNWQPYKKY